MLPEPINDVLESLFYVNGMEVECVTIDKQLLQVYYVGLIDGEPREPEQLVRQFQIKEL